MPAFTLHVVCPNPAVDRLQVVERFRPFEVNRVVEVRSLPGGKGLIVCRGARRLGATVTAHGFVGGATGQVIRDGCAELGVHDRHVEIAGETRVTPVVIDRATGRSTVLNERGPQVTEADQERLLAGLVETVRPGDVVVATGSLPPGCAADLHARVARLALERGATAIVDAHGGPLARVLDDARATRPAGRLVVKPNAEELSGVLGRPLPDRAATRAAVRDLHARTGITFVVTLGTDGAVWTDGADDLAVDTPPVETVNATGSGDSFLAGLAVALGREDDPVSALVLASAMGAANAASLEPDVDPVLVERLRGRVTVSRRGAEG
ncbi:1-phosphofructokinase family hexose kinase [Micromonospora sagamiensis]|uniref:1-phosphofructokinase/tagatose 6-phosphate kinase n=1 Tax=Micromonospora sagamiensis TaxID=47875 RepID=A0A562WDV4_9ACTN|nr:1-phosphofructokinase family hexose kinase [Micromonospora sagamiensis]TWJ28396.1 1-phosphofructokinase/tagatose 6-phosphate kinase [Micromonospora sagamiensis]BCL12712.1 1-phosphofructokinase [Micromonospora sagamiensis]